MAGILIDSNILIRLLDKDSKDHASCIAAVTPENVDRFGLCMCVQSMIEFWVVSSRPREQNGLGFPPTSLATELARVEFGLIVNGPDESGAAVFEIGSGTYKFESK